MKTLIAYSTVVLCLVYGMLYALDQFIKMPTVYYDYYTDSCVNVESENNKFSCKNLPKKYHHVYVDAGYYKDGIKRHRGGGN